MFKHSLILIHFLLLVVGKSTHLIFHPNHKLFEDKVPVCFIFITFTGPLHIVEGVIIMSQAPKRKRSSLVSNLGLSNIESLVLS